MSHRLALGRGGESKNSRDPFPAIRDFWERAVFLRLSPNRLVLGSPAKRKPFDPLLDEEGQTLPALLRELRKDQMADLIERILQELQSASDHGVQVLLSSHSPWVLDHVPIKNVLLVSRIEGETVYQQFDTSERAQKFLGSVPAGTRYVQGD